MAYLKFLNSSKIYKCTVIPQDNIATLKFDSDMEVSNAGFDLYLDEKCETDIGVGFYHTFKTIYRNDDTTAEYNGYQLSSDGSVYEEPEPPELPEPTEPYVPTLKEVQEQKISEMNAIQQQVVANGCEVQLSDGTKEWFTLTTNDQLSLNSLSVKASEGMSIIPWHPADESVHCKFYSEEDMKRITDTCMNFVTYHVTYFRDLRIYIRSLQTKEEVNAVEYGIDVPIEYQSEVLQALLMNELSL